MSFPTKACPHGRPAPGVRPQMATVLVTLLALVAVLVPLAGVAEARPGPRDDRPARAVTTSVIGQPPRGYVVPPGSYFIYPNIGRAQRLAIRNRYEPAVPLLEQFLTTQGRGKFVRPLIEALAADAQWGRPIASRIYARARPLYHPLVTRDLDRLGLVTAPPAPGQ